jgi:DNA replication protein DnaC
MQNEKPMQIRFKDYRGMEFKDLTNSEKKAVLNYTTCNGLLYYKSKVLLKPTGKGEDTYAYNYEYEPVCNPLRNDTNYSLSIIHKKETNIFYHIDENSIDHCGDFFRFGAAWHNLRNNEDFPKVMNKIAEDIGLDKVSWVVFDKILNYEHFAGAPLNIEFRVDVLTDLSEVRGLSVGRKKHRSGKLYSVPTPAFILDILDFGNLPELEKNFLNEKKISIEVMKACKAVFLNGFELMYDRNRRFQSKFFKAKKEIWIGYLLGKHYCKIYRPSPKGFWGIGYSRDIHLFFEDHILNNNGSTPIILVPREIDCLVLLSNGYNALTMNTEGQVVSEGYAGYFKEQNYKIVVAYDNDITGIELAKKLHNDYGYPYIKIPHGKDNGIKDVSDLFAKDSDAKNKFDRLISEALKEIPLTPIQEVDEAEIIVNEQITETANDQEIIDKEVINNPITIDEVPVVKEASDNKSVNNALTIKVDVDKENKRLAVRTANQRLADAKLLPNIKSYFGTLFQKYSLTFLFGDAGKGKSILGIAIANAISRGKCVFDASPQPLPNECEPETVLYYDFEMADVIFKNRYSDKNEGVYEFSNKLFVDNIDIGELIVKYPKGKLEEIVVEKIKNDLEETKATVLIIDNITYLTMQSAEDGQVAMALMKLLKQLKERMKISLLILAHTTKMGSLGGVTSKDLAGSKHLINFADSAFCLAASKNDPGLRYLIQTKVRSAEVKYDAQNVILCEIDKIAANLTFQFIGFSTEEKHFFPKPPDKKDDTKKAAEDLYLDGKTYEEIAKELGTSKSTVGRWLKDFKR